MPANTRDALPPGTRCAPARPAPRETSAAIEPPQFTDPGRKA
ncbi:hypothetical protein [Mangrovihabitans endophyticus]|nr:hypothetical protein [Mangrovihabitans endophyticus]